MPRRLVENPLCDMQWIEGQSDEKAFRHKENKIYSIEKQNKTANNKQKPSKQTNQRICKQESKKKVSL